VKDDIHNLQAEELRDPLRQGSEMIQTVCGKLDVDDEMEAAVRRLMRSEGLLTVFAATERENPATALRVLNAALANLVNAHSGLTIEVEFKRRAEKKFRRGVYFVLIGCCSITADVGGGPLLRAKGPQPGNWPVRVILVRVVFMLAFPNVAHVWSAAGHKMIASLAFRQLSRDKQVRDVHQPLHSTVLC